MTEIQNRIGRLVRDHQWLRRPTVNITPIERGGRILIGLAAVIAGVALMSSANSLLALVLEALLVVTGIDIFVSGALGYCSLYHMFGYTPKSLKELT